MSFESKWKAPKAIPIIHSTSATIKPAANPPWYHPSTSPPNADSQSSSRPLLLFLTPSLPSHTHHSPFLSYIKHVYQLICKLWRSRQLLRKGQFERLLVITGRNQVCCFINRRSIFLNVVTAAPFAMTLLDSCILTLILAHSEYFAVAKLD